MDQDVKKQPMNKELRASERMQDALSITKHEFAKYFEEFESKCGELQCPMCRTSMWIVPSREDNPELMAILTMPIPMSNGRGMWIYPVYCKECGYVSSFASNHVAAKIRGKL